MNVKPQTVDLVATTGSEQFRQFGYVVLPQLIEQPLVDFLWSYVHTKFASLLLSSGDRVVPNTPSGYGDPAFDGLLEHVRSRIEEQSGLALHPTYSYFRLYKHGDVLRRHRDRPSCEISVSLNIGQIPAIPLADPYRGEFGPTEHRSRRATPCSIAASIFSTGASPIQGNGSRRFFCIMSIAAGCIPIGGSTDEKR